MTNDSQSVLGIFVKCQNYLFFISETKFIFLRKSNIKRFFNYCLDVFFFNREITFARAIYISCSFARMENMFSKQKAANFESGRCRVNKNIFTKISYLVPKIENLGNEVGLTCAHGSL